MYCRPKTECWRTGHYSIVSSSILGSREHLSFPGGIKGSNYYYYTQYEQGYDHRTSPHLKPLICQIVRDTWGTMQPRLSSSCTVGWRLLTQALEWRCWRYRTKILFFVHAHKPKVIHKYELFRTLRSIFTGTIYERSWIHTNGHDHAACFNYINVAYTFNLLCLKC